MDFETFFNHPFIRMGDPTPQKPVTSTPASATASSPPATAPKTVGRAGAFAHPAQPSPSPPAGEYLFHLIHRFESNPCLRN